MNIQKISIEKLKPAEYNPRKDLKPEDEEYQKIKKSLIEFGYVAPVIVNSDMTVIGGHQRLKVLKELGYTEIECNIVDLDKDKEKALNIALNKITGEWDNAKLEELLAELKEADIDMDMTGFSFDEVDNMLKDITGSKEDDFDLDQALDEIEEPVSKPGDVWILGRHRLMCGNSTQKEDVMHLMNKQEADMLLTDPPYNVDYEGKTSAALKIENDNMNETEFYNFLIDAFRNMFESVKHGGSIYVFHADTEGLNFRNAFKAVGFKLAQCLVWVKNTFVMGRQDYQWRHEPILYGWKEGAGHYFIDDRTISTILEGLPENLRKMSKVELVELVEKILNLPNSVIEDNKPTKSVDHPTMKPITLIAKLIQNSSRERDIVFDAFGGSGSTLMACEQLNRISYNIELDEKYCDVIVRRFIKSFGANGITLIRDGREIPVEDTPLIHENV